MKEVRVAIIGFGGIARSHANGYKILAGKGAPVKLVALCDIDEKRFTENVVINLDTGESRIPADCKTYTDIDKMLAEVEFDMADICLPTYLHKEYAIKMMNAGKHVLSEKPMALDYEGCLEMIEVSKKTGKRLMIAQCLRFDSKYGYLKECVDNGRYGKLIRLHMERLSVLPTWGFENWFCDVKRSGGCILDMHIHDIDMARYLLGEPESVNCWVWEGESEWQVVNSRLNYNGASVIADASWDEPKGWTFKSGFRARFEKAEVFTEGSGVKVLTDAGESIVPEIPASNYMAAEIEYIANLILNPTAENKKNPPESAAESVRLIEKLRESALADSKRVSV